MPTQQPMPPPPSVASSFRPTQRFYQEEMSLFERGPASGCSEPISAPPPNYEPAPPYNSSASSMISPLNSRRHCPSPVTDKEC